MSTTHTPLRQFFAELESREWDYLTSNEIYHVEEKRGWLPQELSDLADLIRENWRSNTGGETY